MAMKGQKNQSVSRQIPSNYDTSLAKYFSKTLTGECFRLVDKHEVAVTVGLSPKPLKNPAPGKLSLD